jgi:hypothetical protein
MALLSARHFEARRHPALVMGLWRNPPDCARRGNHNPADCVTFSPVVILSAVVILLLAVAGCGRIRSAGTAPQDGFSVTMTAQPAPPMVGDSQLVVTLHDPAGKPVTGARLEIEGNMNHAGMKPSFGKVTAAETGQYMVAIQWTMGGDWTVDIKATLADGRVIARRFPITVHAK